MNPCPTSRVASAACSQVTRARSTSASSRRSKGRVLSWLALSEQRQKDLLQRCLGAQACARSKTLERVAGERSPLVEHQNPRGESLGVRHLVDGDDQARSPARALAKQRHDVKQL